MRTYFIQFIMCIFEAKICDALYANHIPRKVHKPDYQLERLEVDTQKIVGFGFHPIKDWISSPFIGLQTVSLFQNILRIEFGDILGYCRDAEAGLAGDVGNDELPFLKNGVQNDVSYKTTQIAVVGCGCTTI